MLASGDRPRRGSGRLWLAVGLAGLAGWQILAHLPPLAHADLVLCVFRRLTGIPCPGCGLTRAFQALAVGDAGSALAFHPLAPLIALQLVVFWGLWGVRLLRRPRRPLAGVAATVAIVNAVALLGLWGLRFWNGTLPY